MKTALIFLCVLILSCQGSDTIATSSPPFKEAEISLSCAVLVESSIEFRNRCDVDIPDVSDVCARQWSVDCACQIARCGWHLYAMPCELDWTQISACDFLTNIVDGSVSVPACDGR